MREIETMATVRAVPSLNQPPINEERKLLVCSGGYANNVRLVICAADGSAISVITVFGDELQRAINGVRGANP